MGKGIVLLFAALLASCAATVSQIGPDTYTVLLEPRPLTSLRKIQGRAAESADGYCSRLGRDAHITQADETKLTFTCLVHLTFKDRMSQALASRRGQNIRAVVNLLGYPTSQREILGDTVYEWRDERYEVQGQFSGAITYGGGTFGSEHFEGQVACLIQLATTAEGAVSGFQWRGSERGCAAYLQALQGH